MTKQPETMWTCGHPEEETPSFPNLPYTIKGDSKPSFCPMFYLKNALARPTWEGATDVGDGILPGDSRRLVSAVKLDYSCLSLLVLLDLLHRVGIFKGFEWDFLFYLPGRKKKPFGNGAICYCLGSLFIWQLANG